MAETPVDPWQLFAEEMAYEGALPLLVEPLDALPDPVEGAGYNERNLQLLRTLASLDERRAAAAEEDTPLSQELERLEGKVNVLIEMVNRLLLPGERMPPRHPCRLNSSGLLVPAQAVPAAETLKVSIHFDACRALPLELPARAAGGNAHGQVLLLFPGLSELVAQELQRFVFRHHRRKVAEARLTGP